MILNSKQIYTLILIVLTTFNFTIAQTKAFKLEKTFLITELNRERNIWIYLPKNYNESNETYPVLYMHDAQNLFEDSTSFSGEWEVDESLNALSSSLDFNLIVVGIENHAEKRINEMSPWQNRAYGEAEGETYMNFIVKQIKPYIDSAYRTITDKENTAIMGSSMGGLISHYAIYKYPDIFGKAAIFSPSYWFADKAYDFTLDNPIPNENRLYLYSGKKEGEMMVNAPQTMYDYIIKSGHPKQNIHLVIDPNGEHNEASWGKHFSSAIKWLFKL